MQTTLHTPSPTVQRSLRSYTANGVAFTMVAIPKGSFVMGDDESGREFEKPAHRVDFAQAYELGQYAVTHALWEAVMGEPWPHLEFLGDSRRPVDSISWDDIMGTEDGVAKESPLTGFLHRLNALPEIAARNAADGCQFALPTEAQWEYAARGGHYGTTLPSTYAGSNYLSEVGWYNKNSQEQTHPVGRKYPNALGLYDMSGNVREWCADVWQNDYKNPSKDGSARTAGENKSIRVVRGGSWFGNYNRCRVSSRNAINHYLRDNDIGFRLARYRVTL